MYVNVSSSYIVSIRYHVYILSLKSNVLHVCLETSAAQCPPSLRRVMPVSKELKAEGEELQLAKVIRDAEGPSKPLHVLFTISLKIDM